ncbi:SRPBCC family protein [Longimicrobium sp.]|uniref:SRPBCC family protein n=1 Tax=Longimicrobium sp. TaxID=2029185 RepID=UPI003B3B2FCE
MSTPTQPPVTVRVTRRFAASAERVFDAFLDPDKAGRFMFATAAGQMVRAETDPRVGGRYVFTDRRDGEDVEHFGEYLEIDRPRRLVFTFSVDRASTEADRVAIDIVPLQTGCELTLTHEMKPEWAAYADRTEQGWTGMIDGLARVLGE